MEVGLSPGDFVLDGDPAQHPQKGGGAVPPPQFSAHVYSGQTAGCIRMAWRWALLGPGNTVLDGDSTPLPKKGGRAPNFQPMCIAAKRMHGSRCHLVRR